MTKTSLTEQTPLLGLARLPLCCPAHISHTPPPCIHAAPHDISLLLERQLVLELEEWELAADSVDILPGGRSWSRALPVNKNLPDTMRQTRLDSTVWFRDDYAMADCRKGRWHLRGFAVELLQEAYVEDIM
ncbi:hypothetical protein GUJ93_ZPchr0002g26664 [Zizania palustris]|uniref:Uncharacterized protein n=1 Tax=Zizania palustris TaxID=103762 RepID=A0A8J5S6R6_ZIZPA|nr:hypothetical protein GUJ93_ZPchr0002g26664 [Zizania palustris]